MSSLARKLARKHMSMGAKKRNKYLRRMKVGNPNSSAVSKIIDQVQELAESNRETMMEMFPREDIRRKFEAYYKEHPVEEDTTDEEILSTLPQDLKDYLVEEEVLLDEPELIANHIRSTYELFRGGSEIDEIQPALQKLRYYSCAPDYMNMTHAEFRFKHEYQVLETLKKAKEQGKEIPNANVYRDMAHNYANGYKFFKVIDEAKHSNTKIVPLGDYEKDKYKYLMVTTDFVAVMNKALSKFRDLPQRPYTKIIREFQSSKFITPRFYYSLLPKALYAYYSWEAHTEGLKNPITERLIDTAWTYNQFLPIYAAFLNLLKEVMLKSISKLIQSINKKIQAEETKDENIKADNVCDIEHMYIFSTLINIKGIDLNVTFNEKKFSVGYSRDLINPFGLEISRNFILALKLIEFYLTHGKETHHEFNKLYTEYKAIANKQYDYVKEREYIVQLDKYCKGEISELPESPFDEF